MDGLRARAFLDLVLGKDSRPRAPQAPDTTGATQLLPARVPPRAPPGTGPAGGAAGGFAGRSQRLCRWVPRPGGRTGPGAGRAGPGRPVAGP